MIKALWLMFFLASAIVSVFSQTRTVTNADLEKFRQERLKTEEEYKRNYAKWGMPSPAELEKINEQKRRELEQTSARLQQERLQTQNDIVSHANALRAQIASVEAQLRYLRAQRSNFSNRTIYFSSFSYVPFYYPNLKPNYPPQPVLPPNLQKVQDYASRFPSPSDVFNQSLGRPQYFSGPLFFRKFYRGAVIPVFVGSGDYVQAEINSQIVYLEQMRAGLLAQWRLLEDEARRAGVRIDY